MLFIDIFFYLCTNKMISEYDITRKLSKEVLTLYLQLVTNGKTYTKYTPSSRKHPIHFYITRDGQYLYWNSSPRMWFSKQKNIDCKTIQSMTYVDTEYKFIISMHERTLTLYIPSSIDAMQLYQLLIHASPELKK